MKAAAGAVLAAATLASPAAHAAGGHHAVDDAALLDPGQCQVETWAESGPGNRTAPHAAPACRVGPVELELDADRVRGSADGGALQVKWAQSVGLRFAAGLVAAARWQDGGRLHAAGATVVLPLTWQPLPALWLHANLGRDLQRDAADRWRNGVAVEWGPAAFGSIGAQPRISFVAERFRSDGADHDRGGVRWYATPRFNVDLSHASHAEPGGRGWWTLGLTWVFDAPVPAPRSSPVSGGR